MLSVVFSLCLSSFAGNYLQNELNQRLHQEKAKLEEMATVGIVDSMKHVRDSFDKKILEMADDPNLFQEAVEAARKRAGE